MKFLSKLLLVALLLTMSFVSWATCPEDSNNNYKGDCVLKPGAQKMPPIEDSANSEGHLSRNSRDGQPIDPPVKGKKYLANGWVDHGIVLRARDVGLTAVGVGWGDPTAIVLADGRIRLYVLAERHGIRSLISSDGLHFELEKGARIGQPVSHPEISKDPRGGYRLFYGSEGQSKSAISRDGLNFTVELGSRFSASMINAHTISPISYYDTKQGYVRGYVSDLPDSGSGPEMRAVYSLRSEDLIDWELEELVIGGRRGMGVKPVPINRESEASLSMSAEAPSVYDRGDGTADIYFCFNMLSPELGGPTGIFRTTVDSSGHYSKPKLIVSGCDPNVIRRKDGRFVMYYGDYDSAEGGYVLAISRQL